MDLNASPLRTTVLEVDDSSQIGRARRYAQQLAQRIGFSEEDCGRAALVATELATNISKHAQSGALYLREVPHPDGNGLEIVAADKGPGFDLGSCLPDGFSSRGTSGIGLGAVLRQSQVFDAYSDTHGAVVLARLYRQPCTDPRIGVVHVAMENEIECGDTWRIAKTPGRMSALVIDGLGHGKEAALAAQLGGDAFEQTPFDDPVQLMNTLNAAMSGSRGGAVAIAQFNQAMDSLRFAGIGNIAGFLVNATRSRGLASHPGMVGVQYRTAHTFELKDARGDVLILHSDGIQSRWNLRSYAGLVQRHPAIIATVLYRDFCRGRDDATILVIACGDIR